MQMVGAARARALAAKTRTLLLYARKRSALIYRFEYIIKISRKLLVQDSTAKLCGSFYFLFRAFFIFVIRTYYAHLLKRFLDCVISRYTGVEISC